MYLMPVHRLRRFHVVSTSEFVDPLGSHKTHRRVTSVGVCKLVYLISTKFDA
jgi:hypothetical protein